MPCAMTLIGKIGPDRSATVLGRAGIVVLVAVCLLVTSTCGQVGTSQLVCGKRPAYARQLAHSGGGSHTELGDWPWYAALYLPVANAYRVGCAGTIIDRSSVLTAAHCLFADGRRLSEQEVSVHAGLVAADGFTPKRQTFAASKLIIHPQFAEHILGRHDIALIKLLPDLNPTDFVRPICLWDTADSSLVGRQGTLVGFGRSSTTDPPASTLLRDASLTVVDYADCVRQDPVRYASVATGDMFCAGGACVADRGAGMFFEADGTWYLRGVVSFVPKLVPRPDGACDASNYTVFTDVSRYRSWIMESASWPKQWPVPTDVYELPRFVPRAPTNRTKQLRPCDSDRSLDGTLCNAVAHPLEGDFLLVSSFHSILRLPLDGGRGFRVASATLAELQHDCVAGRLYWSDFEGGRILSANYDGSEWKSFVTGHVGLPQSVTVDWVSRRLYWADRQKRTIEVASLEDPRVRTLLFAEGLASPRGVFADPLRGKLYWSDWDGQSQRIEWSNLDGTDRQLLLDSPFVRGLVSFCVSPATGEFCFTEVASRDIKCFDPFSKQTRTVATSPTSPLGLAATEDRFYWTDLETNEIKSVNLDGEPQQPISSPIVHSQLYEMTIVTDRCPVFFSPCAVNNGACPPGTICLVGRALAPQRSRSCVPIRY